MKNLENQIGKRLMVKEIRRSLNRIPLYQDVVEGEVEVHVVALQAVVWAATEGLVGVEMLQPEAVTRQGVDVVVV